MGQSLPPENEGAKAAAISRTFRGTLFVLLGIGFLSTAFFSSFLSIGFSGGPNHRHLKLKGWSVQFPSDLGGDSLDFTVYAGSAERKLALEARLTRDGRERHLGNGFLIGFLEWQQYGSRKPMYLTVSRRGLPPSKCSSWVPGHAVLFNHPFIGNIWHFLQDCMVNIFPALWSPVTGSFPPRESVTLLLVEHQESTISSFVKEVARAFSSSPPLSLRALLSKKTTRRSPIICSDFITFAPMNREFSPFPDEVSDPGYKPDISAPAAWKQFVHRIWENNSLARPDSSLVEGVDRKSPLVVFLLRFSDRVIVNLREILSLLRQNDIAYRLLFLEDKKTPPKGIFELYEASDSFRRFPLRRDDPMFSEAEVLTTFSEQVRALHAATHLVGVHGAGMINLLWLRPGATVMLWSTWSLNKDCSSGVTREDLTKGLRQREKQLAELGKMLGVRVLVWRQPHFEDAIIEDPRPIAAHQPQPHNYTERKEFFNEALGYNGGEMWIHWSQDVWMDVSIFETHFASTLPAKFLNIQVPLGTDVRLVFRPPNPWRLEHQPGKMCSSMDFPPAPELPSAFAPIQDFAPKTLERVWKAPLANLAHSDRDLYLVPLQWLKSNNRAAPVNILFLSSKTPDSASTASSRILNFLAAKHVEVASLVAVTDVSQLSSAISKYYGSSKGTLLMLFVVKAGWEVETLRALRDSQSLCLVDEIYLGCSSIDIKNNQSIDRTDCVIRLHQLRRLGISAHDLPKSLVDSGLGNVHDH